MTAAIIVGIIALLVGGVVGYFLGCKTPAPVDGRVEGELRLQMDGLKRDLGVATSARLEAEKARAASDARVQSAELRLVEMRETQAAQLAAMKEEHEKGLKQLREGFAALGAEALTQMQGSFLTLANETMAKHAGAASADFTKRQEAIAAVIKPVEELIRATQDRLQKSETNQASAIGEVTKHLTMLTEQSTSLAGETLQLRKVLGSGQARGVWGEESLKRVVEASGMNAHCDYELQTTSDDKRPDLIVNLPHGRKIIIDSKVPDLEFLNALHESDDVKRRAALKAHADKLKTTIKALADKDYPRQFPDAIEFVVLFLPAESLFSAALEGDRDLIIWASERHIMLATPTSLMALLMSVSASWTQHEQTANAREIAIAAKELFSRLVPFLEPAEAGCRGFREGIA